MISQLDEEEMHLKGVKERFPLKLLAPRTYQRINYNGPVTITGIKEETLENRRTLLVRISRDVRHPGCWYPWNDVLKQQREQDRFDIHYLENSDGSGQYVK